MVKDIITNSTQNVSCKHAFFCFGLAFGVFYLYPCPILMDGMFNLGWSKIQCFTQNFLIQRWICGIKCNVKPHKSLQHKFFFFLRQNANRQRKHPFSRWLMEYDVLELFSRYREILFSGGSYKCRQEKLYLAGGFGLPAG